MCFAHVGEVHDIRNMYHIVYSTGSTENRNFNFVKLFSFIQNKTILKSVRSKQKFDELESSELN